MTSSFADARCSATHLLARRPHPSGAASGREGHLIQANYRVDRDSGDFVRMLFEFTDGRSQFVYVRFSQNAAGVDWIQIESPIGELRKVNLVVLLRQIEDLVCGGLSIVGDTVTLRHAVPLADMSVEEFEGPLRAIYGSADRLESSVSFQDAF